MSSTHFADCPQDKYDICTCDMSGEESCLVDWKIKQQEGRLHWWEFTARFSIAGAPEIPKKESINEGSK